MTRESVNVYVAEITRTARFFFHLNYDVLRNRYSDATEGLLGYEYPIPNDRFRLLFRYPDLGHMIYEGRLNRQADIFLYLYERRDDRR